MLAYPHRQLNREFGKNLCLYSPMKTCPVVIWVNLIYKELELFTNGSYKPPLAYISFRTFFLLSSRSRKSWFLLQLFGKVSYHSFKMSLYSFFLLNKKEFLLDSIEKSFASFTWVLIILCLDHLALLKQYQKHIQLQLFLAKNSLTPITIRIIEV